MKSDQNFSDTIRLDHFLANMDYCSRRKAEQFLAQHRVVLDGRRVLEPGVRFNPSNEKLTIDGKVIAKPVKVYFLVNKPKGYVSTVSDEQGRPTVTSLVTTKHRVYPVGRLDVDSHGLVLLTNDGEVTYRLTHPKFQVPKVYRLTIRGKITSKQMWLLGHGVKLKDGKTQPTEVVRISSADGVSVIEVTIKEGRNRQLRRMCEALTLNLLDLERTQMGCLELGGLELGKSRPLSVAEINTLREHQT